MSSPLQISVILTQCAELERTIARFYWALARHYRDDDQLYRLWSKTAREEENHARQFDVAMSLQHDIAGVRTDLETVYELLAEAKAAVDRMVEQPPTRVEALQQAISLEKALADYHVSAVTIFTEPGLSRLFKAMLAADQDHVGNLERQLAVELTRQGDEPPAS